MSYYNHLDIRVDLKCFFQRHRVHIPGVTFGINENRDTALINHRVHRSAESNVGTKYLFAIQHTFADPGLTVHGFSRKL